MCVLFSVTCLLVVVCDFVFVVRFVIGFGGCYTCCVGFGLILVVVCALLIWLVCDWRWCVALRCWWVLVVHGV